MDEFVVKHQMPSAQYRDGFLKNKKNTDVPIDELLLLGASALSSDL